jgi:ElaB/YqjD/DUF883 family membrane-anchored ribosome-binding protein
MSTSYDPLAPTTPEKSKIDSVKETITGAASHLKETASQYGKSTAYQIDRNMHTAAGTIGSTADKLRSKATSGGKTGELAQSAAGKLDTTADYLREFDTRQLLGQAEDWARRNPGMAIASAVGLGFLVGLSLKRDRGYYRS